MAGTAPGITGAALSPSRRRRGSRFLVSRSIPTGHPVQLLGPELPAPTMSRSELAVHPLHRTASHERGRWRQPPVRWQDPRAGQRLRGRSGMWAGPQSRCRRTGQAAPRASTPPSRRADQRRSRCTAARAVASRWHRDLYVVPGERGIAATASPTTASRVQTVSCSHVSPASVVLQHEVVPLGGSAVDEELMATPTVGVVKPA
jgi:hypothetical protein